MKCFFAGNHIPDVGHMGGATLSTQSPESGEGCAKTRRTPLKIMTLRRNAVWTFIGNLAYSGCQWLILVMLSKLTDATMVGQFALGLAVTAPVFQFSNLQLRAVQVTDARNEYRFDQYLGTRLVFTALGLVFVATLGIVQGYSSTTGSVVLLVGIAKAIESVSDIFQGVLQKHEQMHLVSVSMLLKGATSVVAVAFSLILLHNVVASTAALAGAWALTFLFYDIPKARSALKVGASIMPSFDLAIFRRLFALTLPLGFVMMLSSLNGNLPRYFVERHWNERELGIFSALVYCMVAGNTIVMAVAQSASPRLAKYYAQGRKDLFRTLLLRLLGLGLCIGVAGVVVAVVGGRPLLNLIYRPEYAARNDVFICLMVAAGVRNVSAFLGVAMTAMRGFKPQAWIHLACTILGLAACAVLVPRMGMFGAAMAVVILSIASLLGFAWKLYPCLWGKDSELLARLEGV